MSVAIPIPLLQNLPDVNVTPAVGVDEHALVYDHGTGAFVLRAPFAGLLATGATVGATAQAQAFTLGVVTPFIAPAADGTAAWQVRKADKTTAVLNVDTTNARVGIGTAGPKGALHVSAANVGPGSGWNTFGDAYFTSNGIAATGEGGTIALGAKVATDTYAVLGRFGTRIEGAAGTPVGYFAIETTGLEGVTYVLRERMRVSSTGVTTITVTDTTDAAVVNVLKLGKNVYSTGVGAAGLGGAILFQGETSTTVDSDMAKIGALWTTATHATRASALTFSTLTAGGSLTERMRIDGAGNVGIGTTAPATALHVVGAATITAGIRPAANSTTALQLQNAAGTSVLNVDTTNGNVGIGTTGPTARLSVIQNVGNVIGLIVSEVVNDGVGSIRLGSNVSKGCIIWSDGGMQADYNGLYLASNEKNLSFAQANTALPSWGIDLGGADNITFTGTKDTFRISRKPAAGSYSELFRITNTGLVGIGTTSPATRLDIDAGALTMAEMTAPTGVANKGMYYTRDNGSGKTMFCCKLGDDVEIVLATQA